MPKPPRQSMNSRPETSCSKHPSPNHSMTAPSTGFGSGQRFRYSLKLRTVSSMVWACCSFVSSPVKLKSMAGISREVGAEHLIDLRETLGGPGVLPYKGTRLRTLVLHRGFMESPCRSRRTHIFI